MTVFKSGDLVVLKSGGPTMTVDTVNTDIFDDDKITGVLCVWFVGDKLQRVRFDHQAIEPAPLEEAPVAAREAAPQVPASEYQAVLDDMVDAMNVPAEASAGASSRKPKSARAAKTGIAASTVITGIGSP
jgi:uncharacterized protein YodC (DUF2158 family)